MVLPGHLAGGYLAARALLFLTHASFSPVQTTALSVIGTLAGELPDIDIAFPVIKHALGQRPKSDDHRQHITHAPLFWLVISLVIVILGRLAGNLFTQYTGWLILCGTFTHFILDSLEYGVRWLWPLSDKRFALRQPIESKSPITAPKGSLRYYWQFVTGPYLKTWTLWAEILVTLAAIWVLFR